MRTRAVGFMLGVLACSARVHAQSASATATWEVSSDGGSSWLSGDVVVPADQASVLVRLSMAFTTQDYTPNPNNLPFLSQIAIDTFSRSIAGAGLGDTASQVLIRRTTGAGSVLDSGSGFGFVPTRVGDVLKIDAQGDTLPPGMGLGWCESFNDITPIGGRPSRANPIVMFQYSLTLDGSLGRREFGAVFGDPLRSTQTNPNTARVYLPPFGYVYAPITQIPAAIVVPGPGVAVLGGVALCAIPRRRRRDVLV